MRIALVHSFYSSHVPSGENLVVRDQAEALTRAGHDVLLVEKCTDDLIRRPGYAASAAWNVATGQGPSPIDQLREFAPDVVHVHNLFPNWGQRWLSGWRGPVVATVHNFRPMCAAGTLNRNGRECTLCPDGSSIHAIRNRCYKDSAIASIPLAISTRHGGRRNVLLNSANAIVVLSPRSKEVYLERGVNESKVHVIPNFVVSERPPKRVPPGSPRWLFAGRLSPEKGILELLRNWPVEKQLDIYGDGPLRREVESLSAGLTRVEVNGAVDRSEVTRKLQEYTGVVVPSVGREGAAPLTYVEALAAGRPIVTLSGNAAADDVIHSGSGIAVSSLTEVGRALESVEADWTKYSGDAYTRYLHEFSESRWLARTEELYALTISNNG